MTAGRSCPLDYHLPSDSFAGAPLFDRQTLYIVGGLYGNRQALTALEKRLAAEPDAKAVFNGDMHWFDVEPALFSEIETRLAAHTLLRGNVETELGRPDDSAAGCGCAYPDAVDDHTVERSNQIHARLSSTVNQLPGMAKQLADRPATALVSVAGKRIAITHGDETSLAGWACARSVLAEPARQQALQAWAASNHISVLATSHTCAPAALAMAEQAVPGLAIINNGAAGMPNFNNGRYGLVTRISTHAHPSAIYRAQCDGLVVEAIPLNYSHDGFMDDFDRQWPENSPAALSYRERILRGTADAPADAMLGGFVLGQTLCAMTALD
ncbi:hypothetical protein [Halopseudomonas salina]|uniref:Metallophosphoesterase n=1 Tax=Halopseudomonas salina TaxID=1323744 RepID=A0ABQ1PI81_9GAMM|nr:hypothetical protein [Halopseudomonas salina]GGC97549.1 hypothetical protein GCM10007418_16170 [Halopseudomonas salina]